MVGYISRVPNLKVQWPFELKAYPLLQPFLLEDTSARESARDVCICASRWFNHLCNLYWWRFSLKTRGRRKAGNYEVVEYLPEAACNQSPSREHPSVGLQIRTFRSREVVAKTPPVGLKQTETTRRKEPSAVERPKGSDQVGTTDLSTCDPAIPIGGSQSPHPIK